MLAATSDNAVQQQYQELLGKFENTRAEKNATADKLKKMQESFARKELEYRVQLAQLEAKLSNLEAANPGSPKVRSPANVGAANKQAANVQVDEMDEVRRLHEHVQQSVSAIEGKTAMILQDQERDLIRAFQARLAEVNEELEVEKRKNREGSKEWVALCQKLTDELDWLRDLTGKLTEENKVLAKESKHLKLELKSQEEDRVFLIKQLVTVKKENGRLRYTFEQHQGSGAAGAESKTAERGSGSASFARSTSSLPTPVRSAPAYTAGAGSGPASFLERGKGANSKQSLNRSTGRLPQLSGQASPAAASSPASFSQSQTFPNQSAQNDSEASVNDAVTKLRYERVVANLQRQLETEKGKARRMKTAYTSEVASRTELQNFLKRAIADARASIWATYAADKGLPPQPPMDLANIPLEEFSQEDRVKVMQWLLTQDHILYALYDKMFPRVELTRINSPPQTSEEQRTAAKNNELNQDAEDDSVGRTAQFDGNDQFDEGDLEENVQQAQS